MDGKFVDLSGLMHCGVYCLLRRGEVVYVGKSRKPLIRLYSHYHNQGRIVSGNRGPTHDGVGINFDGIWFLPCMLGQLATLEGYFIRKYLPRYNTRGKPVTPIPAEIKALLTQMVIITDLPPQQDSFQRFIPRRL